MARITVLDFRMTRTAESKFWTHGIDVEQVFQMLENEYVVDRNRKHRAAGRVLIGRDNHGRCIAVPILPTDDPTIWRPVTAWYCKPAEFAKLRAL